MWYKHVFMDDSVELLDKYIVFTEFDAIDASEPLKVHPQISENVYISVDNDVLSAFYVV